MSDSAREVVGFVCRWCLLGVTLLASVLAVGLPAASTLAAGAKSARLTFADSLGRAPDEPRRRPNWLAVRGVLLGDDRAVPFPLTAIVLHEDRLIEGYPFYSVLVRYLPADTAASYQMEYRGLPYGVLAFESHEVSFRVIEPDQPVLLVDAQQAISAGRRGSAELAQVLKAPRHGELVALVSTARGDQFEQVRQEVRRLGIRMPLLGAPAAGPKDRALYLVGRSLGFHATLRTADADLAAEARQHGLTVTE